MGKKRKGILQSVVHFEVWSPEGEAFKLYDRIEPILITTNNVHHVVGLIKLSDQENFKYFCEEIGLRCQVL